MGMTVTRATRGQANESRRTVVILSLAKDQVVNILLGIDMKRQKLR
jgi:hypothetical protein